MMMMLRNRLSHFADRICLQREGNSWSLALSLSLSASSRFSLTFSHSVTQERSADSNLFLP